MISKKCSCSKRMPGECWGFRGPLVFSQGPRWVRGHPLYPPLLNSGCVYRELVALTLCQLPAYIYEPNLYPTVYMYIVYIIYHTLNKPIHTGCPIHYVQFLIAYIMLLEKSLFVIIIQKFFSMQYGLIMEFLVTLKRYSNYKFLYLLYY